MRMMKPRACLALCMWLFLWCMPSQGWAQTAAPHKAISCTPQLTGAWAAQEVEPNTRPSSGWEAISLPESWHSRWPDWKGPTWYRIEWHVPCPDAHLALSISAIRNAGAVYWNGERLWQDRRLEPPYSRSGNVPRWWPVSTAQRGHEQSALIRVVSSTSLNQVWAR